MVQGGGVPPPAGMKIKATPLGGGVRGVLRHPPTQDEGTHPDPPPLKNISGGGGGVSCPRVEWLPGPTPEVMLPWLPKHMVRLQLVLLVVLVVGVLW